MKTKNYTGTSRPCGYYDKILLSIIENNLNSFNANKRKGVLTVEHYIDGGDQWRVLKDGKAILNYMTLYELHYVVAGIINYTVVKEVK